MAERTRRIHFKKIEEYQQEYEKIQKIIHAEKILFRSLHIYQQGDHQKKVERNKVAVDIFERPFSLEIQHLQRIINDAVLEKHKKQNSVENSRAEPASENQIKYSIQRNRQNQTIEDRPVRHGWS